VGTPQRIDVAQVLIDRDGKVLVVHTLTPDGNIDRWGLPGGGREAGETLVEAAAREAREETGLDIEVGELLALGEWIHGTHDLFAVFRARADGDPHPQAGEVVVECRWISVDEADALMPWYPGGVRALLEGCVGYYVDRSSS
jgi:8-oxo-dGTP diphosphatase